MAATETEQRWLILTEAEEAKVRAWAATNGYEARASFFYDEEGVDGWYWDDPEGECFDSVTGDHNDPPPVTLALFERFLAATPA